MTRENGQRTIKFVKINSALNYPVCSGCMLFQQSCGLTERFNNIASLHTILRLSPAGIDTECREMVVISFDFCLGPNEGWKAFSEALLGKRVPFAQGRFTNRPRRVHATTDEIIMRLVLEYHKYSN